MKDKKIWFLIFALLSIFLYVPLNRFLSGGFSTFTALDSKIIIIPIFVVPYLFGTVLFLVYPIYSYFTQKAKTYYPYIFSVIISAVFSSLIYFFIPTYVTRQEITGSDIFSNLLKLVYQNDNVYNAFPSGHVFFSTIILLNLIRCFPKKIIIWNFIYLLIVLSTLFTGQHYLADVISGIIFGLICSYLGDFIYKKYWSEKIHS